VRVDTSIVSVAVITVEQRSDHQVAAVDKKISSRSSALIRNGKERVRRTQPFTEKFGDTRK
jgi:hypothetical protein